jgi:16S rRNA (guanine1516-N2)-methyltransferase
LSNPFVEPNTNRDSLRVVCTTPTQDSSEARALARVIAGWFHCAFVERANRSLSRVLQDEGSHTLIVADLQPKLYSLSDVVHPLFFHPGMAQQRLIRMSKGEPDRLVTVSGIRPGDVFVDGTFGLGTDSLVMAAAVTSHGRVHGIESSPCLAQLFTYAQMHTPTPYPAVDPLLERIQLHMGEHVEVLQRMPDNSADVVYFDPMFRKAPNTDTNLDVVRPWANPRALSDEAWQHAQRVARRSVVLKERLASGQFERFGVHPDKRTTRFAFGVWRKE